MHLQCDAVVGSSSYEYNCKKCQTYRTKCQTYRTESEKMVQLTRTAFETDSVIFSPKITLVGALLLRNNCTFDIMPNGLCFGCSLHVNT